MSLSVSLARSHCTDKSLAQANPRVGVRDFTFSTDIVRASNAQCTKAEKMKSEIKIDLVIIFLMWKFMIKLSILPILPFEN